MSAWISGRTTRMGRRVRRDSARISFLPRVSFVPLAILCGIIAGCGGGGGSATSSGDGSGNPSASLVVTPTSVKVSTTTADSAPSTTIQASIIASASGTSYYVTGSTTYNGIATASDAAAGPAVDFNLTFKSPASIGVGTYTDTLTVEACYDKACTRQISGSPRQIPVTYTVQLPGPAIGDVQPYGVAFGGSSFTLQVTGTGFTSQSVVEWNGTPLTTTYVSSTILDALVPATDIAQPGYYNITISPGTADTAPSNSFSFPVYGPQIYWINPSVVGVDSPEFTLTISGANFTSSSVVEWNGAPLTTTYVSSTTLDARIPSADTAQAGDYSITVSAGATQAFQSNSEDFQVSGPVISEILPNSASAGAPGFDMTVYGEYFTSSSLVEWNGAALSTTYVSSGQLTAQVPTSDLTTAGTATVTAVASSTNDTTSSASDFTIKPIGALSLTSISPGTVYAGGPAYFLTVLGQGFTAGSVVQWNGSARTTRYVSDTEILGQISAGDIAAAGSATVDVQNSTSQGGTTGSAIVTILPPLKDAVAFQINPQHSGVVSFNSASLPASSTWSVDVGGAPSYALIVSGKVILTVELSGDPNPSSELLALDQKTGTTVWGPISISGFANATYDDGTVFVVSTPSFGASTVLAYDAGTGAPKWVTQLPGSYGDSSGLTAADDHVFTSTEDSTFYALDESSGAVVWTQMVLDGFDSMPAATADGVYVDYGCQQVYDLRPATGETIWHNNSGCSGGGGTTTVTANGVLYAPGGNTAFNGNELNAEAGTVLGAYTADNPPAIGSQTGYFLQNGTLTAISLGTGTILWTFTGDGKLITSPILVNQYVFIGSTAGNLYALDAATGSVAWQQNVGAALPAGPGLDTPIPLSGLSAGDGLLVVPAGTKVIAYTLSTNP